MLNKQELINAKVLVPILRNELEESESREQGRRVMLVNGFPRNLAQQREFEKSNKHAREQASSGILLYVLTQQASRKTYTLFLF